MGAISAGMYRCPLEHQHEEMCVPVDVIKERGCTGFDWLCGGFELYTHMLVVVRRGPMFLVFRDVLSKDNEDRFVISLRLTTGLRMVRPCGEVF